MIVVGLTGQSGAGKTAAGKIFAEHGFAVIDADKVAREVMRKGSDCLAETAARFGEEYLLPDGTLDRRKLAGLVFSDKAALNDLERITYPHINRRVEEMIEESRRRGEKYLLLDAPTLFEAGEEKLCSCIAAVVADEAVRRERIIQRDGISAEQVRRRFENQRSTGFFRANSDYIIENGGTEEELAARTEDIIRMITERFQNE